MVRAAAHGAYLELGILQRVLVFLFVVHEVAVQLDGVEAPLFHQGQLGGQVFLPGITFNWLESFSCAGGSGRWRVWRARPPPQGRLRLVGRRAPRQQNRPGSTGGPVVRNPRRVRFMGALQSWTVGCVKRTGHRCSVVRFTHPTDLPLYRAAPGRSRDRAKDCRRGILPRHAGLSRNRSFGQDLERRGTATTKRPSNPPAAQSSAAATAPTGRPPAGPGWRPLRGPPSVLQVQARGSLPGVTSASSYTSRVERAGVNVRRLYCRCSTPGNFIPKMPSRARLLPVMPKSVAVMSATNTGAIQDT